MKWFLFICSDCDTDGGLVIVPLPEGSSHDRSSGIDYCPGCGNYFSLLQQGEVEVKGNPLVMIGLRETAEA